MQADKNTVHYKPFHWSTSLNLLPEGTKKYTQIHLAAPTRHDDMALNRFAWTILSQFILIMQIVSVGHVNTLGLDHENREKTAENISIPQQTALEYIYKLFLFYNRTSFYKQNNVNN